MCESNAFLKKGDTEELVLENVSFVHPKDGKLVLASLFGDEVVLDAVIVQIDLMAHKILLEER